MIPAACTRFTGFVHPLFRKVNTNNSYGREDSCMCLSHSCTKWWLWDSVQTLFGTSKNQVQEKLYLHLTKPQATRPYMESGDIAPYILNHGSRWKSVVSLTLQMLYLQRKIPWHPLDRRMGRYSTWAEYRSALFTTVTEVSHPNTLKGISKKSVLFSSVNSYYLWHFANSGYVWVTIDTIA